MKTTITTTINAATVTMDELVQQIKELNEIKNSTGNTDDTIKAIKRLIADENSARANKHTETVLDIIKNTESVAAGLDYFVDHQVYTTVMLDWDAAKGSYSLAEASKQLCFKTLADIAKKNGTKLVEDTFFAYVSLFLHNLYINRLTDYKLDKKIKSRLSISEELANVAKHNARGIFGCTSTNKLQEQLTYIFDMVVPGVKPVKADLNFCRDIMSKGIILAGNDTVTGKLVIRNETTLQKALFTAMRMRKNNLRYDVSSQGNVHKVEPEKMKTE